MKNAISFNQINEEHKKILSLLYKGSPYMKYENVFRWNLDGGNTVRGNSKTQQHIQTLEKWGIIRQDQRRFDKKKEWIIQLTKFGYEVAKKLSKIQPGIRNLNEADLSYQELLEGSIEEHLMRDDIYWALGNKKFGWKNRRIIEFLDELGKKKIVQFDGEFNRTGKSASVFLFHKSFMTDDDISQLFRDWQSAFRFLKSQNILMPNNILIISPLRPSIMIIIGTG